MKTGKVELERRDFIKKIGKFAIVSPFVLSSILACSDDDANDDLMDGEMDGELEAIKFSDGQISLNLDLLDELNQPGGWLIIDERKVLILNTGDGEFSALSSICTHQQCDNNWTFKEGILNCTCHNSLFETDGSIISGPANTPLASYDTSQVDNLLTIFK